MKQIHAHGHLIAEMEPVKVSDVAPAATKTFAVTAQKFSFTFTPSPFAVNQGDTVTLDITSSDVTHGFFIEQYFGGTTIDKGQD